MFIFTLRFTINRLIVLDIVKGGDAEDVTVAEVRFRHISARVLSTWKGTYEH